MSDDKKSTAALEEYNKRAWRYLHKYGQKLIDITSLPYDHHSQFGCAYVIGTTRKITDHKLCMIQKAFPSMSLMENVYALLDFTETPETSIPDSTSYSGM
eukprot:Pgem_evm1s3791